ncbi:MAG: ATP-binding protein [Deltaproteobacteria bacterium]|nr:ATP-binding protein [Deltaproteobacteria bacterium]
MNVFLDAARKEVPVAGPDQFVGRRREVQRAIRAMRPASEKKGVVFFGQGGWGKSSTALRVIQRLEAIDGTNTVIVLHQAFDADTILDRVHDALIRLPAATKEIVEIRRQISDGGNAEEALFSGLTRLLNLDDLRNRPVVFVLDDFEWALDRTEPRDRFQPLHPLVAPLRGLVQAVRHAPAAKMIVTTRYRFQLPDRNGYDLFDGFEEIPLRPFGEDEMMRAVRRRMQPDALQRLEEKSVRGKELRTAVTRCMGACFGNPRLLGLLVDVAVADVSKASALIDRMESDQKAIVTAEADSAGGSAEFNEVLEFYRRLALTELLSLAGADTQALLRAATVFFLPVPAEVFMAAAPNGVDAPRAVERATSNGLLEVFRHRDGKLSYRVPDIVRLLLKPLKKDEEVQVSNACVDMLFDSWGGINNSIQSNARSSYL